LPGDGKGERRYEREKTRDAVECQRAQRLGGNSTGPYQCTKKKSSPGGGGGTPLIPRKGGWTEGEGIKKGEDFS